MYKRNITLIFSDLEGTLLEEESKEKPCLPYTYNSEKMKRLISKLDEYQNVTNSEIMFNIDSPIDKQHLLIFLKLMDKEVEKYNFDHNTNLNSIVYATAEEDCLLEKDTEFFFREKEQDSRILPLHDNPGEISRGIVGSGKKSFIEAILRGTNSRKDLYDLKNVIYFGNGRNDVQAVRLVNSLENSYTICPQNSRHEIKALVDHVGSKTDCDGVTEGMEYIIEQERLKKDKNLKELKPKDDDFER
jgi:hydroxymethylpyrimidine pyrophosphatase-like HAD family hydrolase